VFALLLLLFLVVVVVKVIQTDEQACDGISYVGIAPDVSEGSIAFGPAAQTRIANFEALSAEEKTKAVVADEHKVGCQYSAQALTQAVHRGLEPWPTSDQDWTTRLQKLHGDRKAHRELMVRVEEWNAKASAEAVYLDTPYNSDWLERTASGPMLRQGPGHDDVAGWVIKWTHQDGTVVLERIICMYQLVIPPGVPGCVYCPPPPPPCPIPIGVRADQWDSVNCQKLPTDEETQQNGDTGVGQEPQDNDTSGADIGQTTDSDGDVIDEPPLQLPTPGVDEPTDNGTNSGSSGSDATDDAEVIDEAGDANGNATNPFGG
jgi:hypothetical protein